MSEAILKQSQKVDRLHTKMLTASNEYDRNKYQILFSYEQENLNKMLEAQNG